MSFTIQLRRGLAATWTSENPVLASGEIGLETDTYLAKVGDGVTAWTGLSYWNPNGGSGGGGAVSSVFGRTGAVTAHTGDYAVAQVTGAAPLASPALTGTPTAPTASALTNSTQLATTAYADAAVAVETTRATTAEALKAPLASPALTGTPTAPTASPGTNTTQLATTAFVESANVASATSLSGGALVTSAKVKTANYTVTTSDCVIFADATGGSFTVTLPSAVGIAGQAYLIFQTTNANNVVVATNGGNISGASTYTLAGQYQAIGVTSDGTNWQINDFPVTQGFQVFGGSKQFNAFAYLEGGAQIKGLAPQITTQTTNYTVSYNDVTVLANGAATITLPSASGVLTPGQWFVIKQIHSGSCTVATTGGNTIDGAASLTLAQYQSVTVASDGSNWYVAAAEGFTRNNVLDSGGGNASITGSLNMNNNPISGVNNLSMSGTLTVGEAAYPGVSALIFVASGTTLVNAQLGNVFGLTLTASTTTLGNPSNPVDGQSIRFRITQGTGGSFTMAWGSAYNFGPGGSAPTLSTAAGAVDVIAFEYEAASSIWRFIGSTIAIANPVPIGNGGTGQTSQQAAINALAGAVTSGDYLRGNGTNVVMSAIQAADLPTGTTSTKGALQLDGTAADIQPTSTAAAAGAVGKAADSGHVHAQTFLGLFGDGSDGSVTFDGTTTVCSSVPSSNTYTLVRNIWCTGITINSGVTVITGAYQIFCAGTITIASTGSIQYNGQAGAANGTAGAALANSLYGGSGAGGAGGTTTGTAASAPANWWNYGCGGGTAGGTGTSGNTGGNGANPISNFSVSGWRYRSPGPAFSNVITAGSSGTRQVGGAGGGGGGGGDGTNKGGGGGSGGGFVAIFAWAIVNNGTITAIGGAGGTPTTGNCGGGGGGGGGLVLLYTLVAVSGSGSTSVLGGTAGSGVGTGSNGSNGNAGGYLNVVLI